MPCLCIVSIVWTAEKDANGEDVTLWQLHFHDTAPTSVQFRFAESGRQTFPALEPDHARHSNCGAHGTTGDQHALFNAVGAIDARRLLATDSETKRKQHSSQANFKRGVAPCPVLETHGHVGFNGSSHVAAAQKTHSIRRSSATRAWWEDSGAKEAVTLHEWDSQNSWEQGEGANSTGSAPFMWSHLQDFEFH